MLLFQSTRPRGTRLLHFVCSYNNIRVSIHASARDATTSYEFWQTMAMFQSTRPRGTRLKKGLEYSYGHCFNPRVRAGRDQKRPGNHRVLPVSIHASARDATGSVSIPSILSIVSIHASARDATGSVSIPSILSIVSIHASARDATR